MYYLKLELLFVSVHLVVKNIDYSDKEFAISHYPCEGIILKFLALYDQEFPEFCREAFFHPFYDT